MRCAWRGSIQGYGGGAMLDLGYELPRIPIPRTWVNKGKKKAGCPAIGPIPPLRLSHKPAVC